MRAAVRGDAGGAQHSQQVADGESGRDQRAQEEEQGACTTLVKCDVFVSIVAPRGPAQAVISPLPSHLYYHPQVQSNQIEQLKEDIHNKDKALVAEQFETASLSKRLEQRNHEVDQLRQVLDDASNNVSKQEHEVAELNVALRSKDADSLAQKRAYDQVVTERDITATQLTRRNDELALLYEKMSIMTTTMSKGEQQYASQQEDIRLMKIKIADLKRQVVILSDGRNHGLEDAKQELVRLQRELLSEQAKTKALSEELENPMNVHRWRKLEGTDPSTLDLLQKCQTLQRRLIAKTEQVVEKDMQMQTKEREVADLKAKIASMPGAELSEQLIACQTALTERTRQLKAVASEVTMAQAQVTEYKHELERTSRELFETKKQFYESRRQARHSVSAGRQQTEASGGLGGAGQGSSRGTGTGMLTGVDAFQSKAESSQRAAAQASQARFVGGGFNVHA